MRALLFVSLGHLGACFLVTLFLPRREVPMPLPEQVCERWRPVTCDYGLVEASLDTIGPVRAEMYREHGMEVDARRLDGPLEAIFGALPPLAPAPTKELYVATDFGWTAFFRNGIAGSDPALAMCQLSRRLGVRAMRVCPGTSPRRYPAVIWEVFAPPALGGDARGRRRSIAAANDGGRWVFEQSGVLFDFEDNSRYELPRTRDRFTPELLSRYLAALGIPMLQDACLLTERPDAPLMLSRPAHGHLPSFSLEEVVAGKPWRRS